MKQKMYFPGFYQNLETTEREDEAEKVEERQNFVNFGWNF